MSPRPLTHDEKKASEAAFRGLPQDDKWTDSAKSVYEGIIQALGKNPSELEITEEASLPALNDGVDGSSSNKPLELSTSDSASSQEIPPELKQLTIRSRREAVESGILKDVTPLAQSIGLEFCVGMTNPLWEQYITSSPDFTEERIHSRLRDSLVAVRSGGGTVLRRAQQDRELVITEVLSGCRRAMCLAEDVRSPSSPK